MTQQFADKDNNYTVQIDTTPEHDKETYEGALAGTFLQFNGSLFMYLMGIAQMLNCDVRLSSASENTLQMEATRKHDDRVILYNCFTCADAYSQIESAYDMAKAMSRVQE